jgi:excisionase family DNA binding protein
MTAGAMNVEPPSAHVIELASRALERVRAYLRSHPQGPPAVSVTVADAPGVEVTVPREIILVLARALSHLADGHAVAVLAANSELTTQQAADILNVSRPFLIKLLDSGAIRHRMVGSHRRVDLQSLLAYKRSDDARSLRAANDLTALDEELGLI